MDTATLIGLAAGALTTGCWVPQLRRSIRTRSMEDVSWGYLLVLAAGVALWLVYGLALGDPAIIITNALTLVAVMTLSGVKWRGAPPGADGAPASG